jgi:hypothetical protein
LSALRAIWCRGTMANGTRCKSMIAALDEDSRMWVVKIGGHKYAFGVLHYHECPDCGEEFGKRPECLGPRIPRATTCAA